MSDSANGGIEWYFEFLINLWLLASYGFLFGPFYFSQDLGGWPCFESLNMYIIEKNNKQESQHLIDFCKYLMVVGGYPRWES